jgi:Down syndrome cell adhesion molecule-like protein 1
VYAPSDSWYDDKSKDYKKTSSSDTVLHGLKKYTNYTIQVLAMTSGGDGVRSIAIHCQTDQDTPEAPTAVSSYILIIIDWLMNVIILKVKALVMSSEAILVSWKPPAHPNGLITKYKVYVKSSAEKENKEFEIPANQMSYEASGLNQNLPYEFWVSALTQIGKFT